jgi:hypothetical protein
MTIDHTVARQAALGMIVACGTSTSGVAHMYRTGRSRPA